MLLSLSSCDDSTPAVADAGGADGFIGIPCPNPPKDTDGDGISDDNEGAPSRDTDGDGIPDYRDNDSDGDGIPDAVEARTANACTTPVDTDGDGKADYVDLDSDDGADGTVPDQLEAGGSPTVPVDTDKDGKPDYMDNDNDGDGIPDIIELVALGGKDAARDLATAPDTDKDGTPDFLDLDSDNDTIADADEHDADVDGDLIPNYRDSDSDGDCVSDAHEAGDAVLATPPVDTDGDGTPDYLDVDTDNDGLVDGDEDKNCSGTLDACETNRLVVDTDGDGVSDLIEVEACAAKTPAEQVETMCTCDGANYDSSPATHGDIIFVASYGLAPSPTTQTVSLSNNVDQADVLFTVDTTSSMQASIEGLKSGLSSMITAVKQRIPDTAFGAFEFRDLGEPQNDDTSNPPDVPSFHYAQRVQTVTDAGLTDLTTAIAGFVARFGGDPPQAGWEALYTLATGITRSIQVTGATTYTLGTNAALLPLSMNETGGTLGGAGFRAGSLPILVTLTDAEWHDAPGSLVAADAESGLDAYPSAACNPCTHAPSRREAITALQAIGAHVIGLAAASTATTGDPKARAVKVALETGAIVEPADFGPFGVRPTKCAMGDCCTGLDTDDNVIGEAALGGLCPLAFTVDGNNGAAVAASITTGLTALSGALRFDVHVEADDVDAGTVDAFLFRVVPNVSGTGAASVCVNAPPSPLQDRFSGPAAAPGGDGVLDTFPGLQGGTLVCFDLVPKTNTTIKATDKPQLFRARLQVRGSSGVNAFNLGVPRDLYFIVPPQTASTPVP